MTLRLGCAGAALLPLVIAAGCNGSSSGGASPTPPGGGTRSGLDSRPPNLTCIAPARTDPAAPEIELERIFAALSFDQPLGMLQAPGDPSRWFVLEKGGTVRAFANDPSTASFGPDFLRLNVNPAGEGGLLGMAFHPDYPADGRVFVSWTEGSSPMVSVVADFVSVNGGATLDPGSRHDVIHVNQDATNHNGGHIVFGPDGYLYFGLGDGGGGGDPLDRAQNTTNLLGSMLRLDVEGGDPYAIPSGPSGNPFAGQPLCPPDHSGSANCPEIFAWGLRNPWRFAFDRETGRLWVGDVGQGAREEIDIVERGGNYGWDCREGFIAHANAAAVCATVTNAIDPVHDYPRTLGQSITGGYVYRGTSIPELVGQYVFGDFVSGRIWRLVDDGQGGYTADELLDTELSIASFAEDADGELYVVDLGGTLHRIVRSDGSGSGEGAPPVAERLSETGCVDPTDPSIVAAGAIPYDVVAPAWFDGAGHERFVAIPDGTAIALDADGRLVLPVGAVLLERLVVDGEPAEVRLLMQHADGDWGMYSYEWDAALRDGVLVDGGKTIDVGGKPWLLPSSAECAACHRTSAGVTLGLEVAQLNRPFTYPSTGRTANQLATFDAIGLLSTRVTPETVPALPSPADQGAPLMERARAYLHANCAHCHGEAKVAELDLRYDTSLALTGTCDVPPTRGDLGIANARIIAPGDADRSVLVARMSRRDAYGMPPLASLEPDDTGVTLIRAFIDALTRCE
ncbi:MAG TPA: PQQ-dependent sugar dehydrogenase [Gammaproteobacteria bacterium]